jgi:hypothetical protein
MPIFPRRQLQLMLDELGPWLVKSKATDLLKRIDNEDPDQSIPGEYELGVGGALICRHCPPSSPTRWRRLFGLPLTAFEN